MARQLNRALGLSPGGYAIKPTGGSGGLRRPASRPKRGVAFSVWISFEAQGVISAPVRSD
jgi:hypothetical protein